MTSTASGRTAGVKETAVPPFRAAHRHSLHRAAAMPSPCLPGRLVTRTDVPPGRADDRGLVLLRAAVLFLQGHGQPTATLAGYVEDAIRERLERERAELNQGEDFPPVTDHLRAPVGGSAGSGLVHSGFRLARML
jgi:hypothetical protein